MQGKLLSLQDSVKQTIDVFSEEIGKKEFIKGGNTKH